MRIRNPFLVLSVAVVATVVPQGTRAQAPVDTLLVTRSARLAGGAVCQWARGNRTELTKGPHTILVRSTEDGGTANEPFGTEVVVRIDGTPRTAADVTATERSLADRAEVWAGKQIAVVTLREAALICTAQIASLARETATAASAKPQVPVYKDFTLLTGAEFSSADGFSSKQVRVPVTADWFVPLKFVSQVGGWLSLKARGEATSLVRARTRVVCSPITQTGPTTSIPPAIGVGHCGRARVDTLAPDTYRVTQYVRRIDAQEVDTMPTTGLVWRATIDLRLERQISESNRAFLGAVVSHGIETNPNVPSSRSIARRSRYGLSLRSLDEAGEERFEMTVSTGHSSVFPTTEVLIRSVDDTVGVLERRPLDAQRVRASTWRIMISPGGGYYLRFIANFNRHFPESASLAVLKSLDFPKLVQSVLGTPK